MDNMIIWFLGLLGVYLALGVLFGVVFVLLGAKKVDPAAVEGTWGFKLLIIPGAAIFWPLLLSRWIRGAPSPIECSAHRKAAEN